MLRLPSKNEDVFLNVKKNETCQNFTEMQAVGGEGAGMHKPFTDNWTKICFPTGLQ